MNETEISDRIAGLFAQVWRNHRRPMFRTYLSISFGRPVVEQPAFQTLSIVEWPKGVIDRWCPLQWWGSEPGKWLVDMRGIRFSGIYKLTEISDDHRDSIESDREFYMHPSIHFHRSGHRIIFGEGYGPRLEGRKRGSISWDGNEPSIIEVEALSQSTHSNEPQQYKPLLDFVPGGVRMVVLAAG